MLPVQRHWVIVGPPEAAEAYAAGRTWLDDDPVIAATAADLRAIDPPAITGILTIDLHALSADEQAAIDAEIEALQGLWPVGVTAAYQSGLAGIEDNGNCQAP